MPHSHCGLEWVLALLAVAGTGAAGGAGGPGRGPWSQEEELAVLGSLDMDSLENLLAFDELRRAKDTETLGPLGPLGPQPLDLAWLPAEPDPRLYLLTEYDRSGLPQPQVQVQTRAKRTRNTEAPSPAAAAAAAAHPGARSSIRRTVRNPPGASAQRLSIVNPLDVLRQRLLLEIARRRKASTLSTPLANRELLEGIGKRSGQGDLLLMDNDVAGVKRADQQEGISNSQRQREPVEGNIRSRGRQDDEPWGATARSARRQANVWSVLTGPREN